MRRPISASSESVGCWIGSFPSSIHWLRLCQSASSSMRAASASARLVESSVAFSAVRFRHSARVIDWRSFPETKSWMACSAASSSNRWSSTCFSSHSALRRVRSTRSCTT